MKLTWKADCFAQPTGQNWIASFDFCFYLPGKVFAPKTSGVDKTQMGQKLLSIGWNICVISWLEDAPQRSDFDYDYYKILSLGWDVWEAQTDRKVLSCGAEVNPVTQPVVPATGLSRALAPGNYLWDNFVHMYSGHWQTRDNSA